MRKRQFIIDLADPRNARVALDALRSFLFGLHKGVVRIEVMEQRRRRSDRQNRFYWPCIVQPLADFLRAQADAPVNESEADDMAHNMLKAQFLAHTVYVGTRKVRYVGSTTALSTAEFNDYLDRCIGWLLEIGVLREAPEPSVYHEKVDRNERVRAMCARKRWRDGTNNQQHNQLGRIGGTAV